jgi:hypothetical protein
MYNPEKKPVIDPKLIKIGGYVYAPDYYNDLGYEKIYVQEISYRRIISNDFGDYFDEPVEDPQEANYYDIIIDQNTSTNPYEKFLSEKEVMKYVFNDLENNTIPDLEKFILMYQEQLQRYKKLKARIEKEIYESKDRE